MGMGISMGMRRVNMSIICIAFYYCLIIVSLSPTATNSVDAAGVRTRLNRQAADNDGADSHNEEDMMIVSNQYNGNNTNNHIRKLQLSSPPPGAIDETPSSRSEKLSCPATLTLHDRRAGADTDDAGDNDAEGEIETDKITDASNTIDTLELYQGFHFGWYHKFFLRGKLGRGTLPSIDDLLVTIPTSQKDTAHFVYWGNSGKGATHHASAYSTTHDDFTKKSRTSFWLNEEHIIVGDNNVKIAFVPPSTKLLRIIPPSFAKPGYVTTLGTEEEGGDYIAFVSLFFNDYQHLLIDHIGMLAYLRKTQPPTTRFILVDTVEDGQTLSIQQELIKKLDPEFYERIAWIHCNSAANCGGRVVQVVGTNGATLRVVVPRVSTRHLELLEMGREWMMESPLYKGNASDSATNDGPSSGSPTQMEIASGTTAAATIADEDRIVIFYTRNAKEASNEGIMDVAQELQMMERIVHMLVRFNRPEQLVVFDGTESLETQVNLFKRASVIIGAHGGGLANIFYSTPPSVSSCGERTKVLEFVTGLDTPQVQNGGSFASTYYTIFTTCPWVELHQMLCVPPSDKKTTYVDMDTFQRTLLELLGGQRDAHSITATNL
jgi:hypothetical protein